MNSSTPWGATGIAVPPNLVDRTNYRFSHPGDSEELVVSFGAFPPGATSIDDVVSGLVKRMEEYAGDQARVRSQESVELDGQEARLLQVALEDDDAANSDTIVVIALDSSRYAQIAYSHATGDSEAAARCEQVVKSLRLDGESPLSHGSDFREQRAGALVFTVPQPLEGPPSYAFVSKDETVRVTLRIFNDDRRRHYDLQAQLERDTQYGAELLNLQTEDDYRGTHITGRVARYRLVHDDVTGPRLEVVRTAMLGRPPGDGLTLYVRATGIHADSTEEVFTSVLEHLDSSE